MINNTIRRLKYIAKKSCKMLLEPVIGYTRVVFATKYFLSFVAIALILVLIILPLINPVHDNFRITFSNIDPSPNEKSPKMINPRFQGVDNDDQTYNITADTAVKKPDNTVLLDNINANITLKNKHWIALTAKTGLFNHENGKLDLVDSVNIFTNEGYNFYTKSLHVDIKNNSAYGNNKIHGNGAIGSITADNFKITEKGNRAIFKGNVLLILNPGNGE